MQWCIIWQFNVGRQIEPCIGYDYYGALIKAVELLLRRSWYVPFTLIWMEP